MENQDGSTDKGKNKVDEEIGRSMENNPKMYPGIFKPDPDCDPKGRASDKGQITKLALGVGAAKWFSFNQRRSASDVSKFANLGRSQTMVSRPENDSNSSITQDVAKFPSKSLSVRSSSKNPSVGSSSAMLQRDPSSRGVSSGNNDIESGDTQSTDNFPSEPRLGNFCSYHQTHEGNFVRLAPILDPLLVVIVQALCSLVAYKSSDRFSPAKDVLFCVLVFVCVLGFLFALGGKWFQCTRMGEIGLLAAALGFLLTMASVVIYKIG